MKPHPRIRKTIKWGGAAVTVLLVVVWIGSGWGSAMCRPQAGCMLGSIKAVFAHFSMGLATPAEPVFQHPRCELHLGAVDRLHSNPLPPLGRVLQTVYIPLYLPALFWRPSRQFSRGVSTPSPATAPAPRTARSGAATTAQGLHPASGVPVMRCGASP